MKINISQLLKFLKAMINITKNLQKEIYRVFRWRKAFVFEISIWISIFFLLLNFSLFKIREIL